MHFHLFKLKYSSTESKELVYRKIFKDDSNFGTIGQVFYMGRETFENHDTSEVDSFLT
jgi:hypothetical protein